MTVRCSQCGEELLGPVNRCWKCGQQFATPSELGGQPPLRGAPPPAPVAIPLVAVEMAASSTTAVPSAPEPLRVGSPFLPPASPPAPSSRALRHHPPPGNPVAGAGAVAAFFLGWFAIGLGFLPLGAAEAGPLVIALVGLGMGIWGLQSSRRGWALLGMLLCCAAIAFNGYTIANFVFLQAYPTAPGTAFEEEDGSY